MDRTMETLVRIAKTEFDGESLMGTAFLPYVKSLPFDKVVNDNTNGGYTVWGVTLHVLFHKCLTIQLVGGQTGLEPFPYEAADWPALPERQDEEGWRRLLEDLELVHKNFIMALENFPMDRWDEVLPEWKCTVGQVMDCIACHDMYHVAQIRNMGI